MPKIPIKTSGVRPFFLVSNIHVLTENMGSAVWHFTGMENGAFIKAELTKKYHSEQGYK